MAPHEPPGDPDDAARALARVPYSQITDRYEAAHESRLMSHAVEKYFRRDREKAVQSWRPGRPKAIERDIGLEAHVQREMPLFLTLRDGEGNALSTAMLPPGGKDRGGFRIIIVAASNADPYPRAVRSGAALFEDAGRLGG
jgi:hypothetical protein